MVDARTMCRQHLLGEHVEIHMFLGAMRRGTSMQGYVDNDLLEARAIPARHDELVAEMKARGYQHHSPLAGAVHLIRRLHPDQRYATIPREPARAELHRRCPECAAMYKELNE